jgi:hypothetical protein
LATERSTKRPETVRYASLDGLPAAPPLTERIKALSDAEIERRAALDPDAGVIPPGFWDKVDLIEAG